MPVIIKGDFKTRAVFLDGKPLYPFESQKVVMHNPTGYGWGYQGSGPSQMALAILLAVTHREEALKYYEHFKREKIADLPEEDFEVCFDFDSWLEARRKVDEIHQQPIICPSLRTKSSSHFAWKIISNLNLFPITVPAPFNR